MLRQAIQCYLQTMLDHRDLSAVLLFEHRSLQPELHTHHVPRRDRFEGLWRDLIRSGIEQSVFANTDPAMTGRALLGAMNWTITWYRLDGLQNSMMVADQYAHLFLNGLLKR